MAVSVVQTAVIANTWSGSFASNVTAGNTVFLVVTAYSSAGATMSSSSPTFNGAAVAGAAQLVSVNSGGSQSVYTSIWMLPAVAGGAASVAVTVSGETAPPNAGAVGLIAYEVAGLGTAPALDKSAASSATTGTAVTTGASGAVTADPEFVLGSMVIYGQTLAPVGSPWTESQFADLYSLAGWQVVTSGASSYTYSQTAGGSAAWCGGIVTVKPGTAPVPFPAAPLDLRCELNLGGTWTDVSAYVYQRAGTQAPVRISRGRPDESSKANPGSCRWEWDNRDGRFSPRNPLSPYYGQLKRNTPVRWSVPAASSYLRLEDDFTSYAGCPTSAALQITGDTDIRLDMAPSDYRNSALAGKNAGGTGPSWLLELNDDGTLTFYWWDSGSVEHLAQSTVPVVTGRLAVRVTLAVASGTVTYYTAPDISGTWTQLGAAVAATGGAATSVFSGTAPVRVGDDASSIYGAYFGFQLLSGIGGTLVADADFTSQAPGATSWTDAYGNTWTLAGTAKISGRDYRFQGEMSALPPRWDVTGTDMAVRAQAGGLLRRLGQGSGNVMSAMKRAVLLQTGAFAPVAYWPMEDAAGATVFGAAAGGLAGSFDANPAPALASSSAFAASAPLPALNGSRVQLPVAASADTGTWTVRFLLKAASSSDAGTLVRIAADSVVYLNMEAGGGLELTVYAPDGTEHSSGYLAYPGVTSGVWCSLEAQAASGGGVQYSLVTLQPGAATGNSTSLTVTSETSGSGAVRLVQLAPQAGFSGTVIGHLQVQSAWQSLFAFGQPLNAWTGETAAYRYARVAGENGYQVRIVGSPASSAAMGPQGQATLGSLLQECESADRGQQFEPRTQLALGYRTLASMCNQSPVLSLGYTASQPGGAASGGGDSGLDPTYDDLLTANDWTVTRGAASGSQGATWQSQLADGSDMSTSAPPAGAGDYGKSLTVNVEYDSQLPDVAGWLVHLGTVDDERWPAVPVNLARAGMSALSTAALTADAGDMTEITSLPDTVVCDPVTQLVLGFKESLGGYRHTIVYSAVPEAPYEVIILDDLVYGRVDTDGSTLAAAVSATATTLSVATAAGFPVWTTAASDVPFDIAVSGERMTVTAVSGTASPQTLTVTRSVNGVAKSQAAGADVRLWFPPVLALT